MKKVKLKEDAYRKLVNELKYGTVDNAYDRLDDIFSGVTVAFEYLDSAIDEAIYNVKWESAKGEQTENPYLMKIREYADAIGDILEKKKLQKRRFFNATTGSVDTGRFFKSPESRSKDLDDMDLTYMQNNYPKG